VETEGFPGCCPSLPFPARLKGEPSRDSSTTLGFHVAVTVLLYSPMYKD